MAKLLKDLTIGGKCYSGGAETILPIRRPIVDMALNEFPFARGFGRAFAAVVWSGRGYALDPD